MQRARRSFRRWGRRCRGRRFIVVDEFGTHLGLTRRYARARRGRRAVGDVPDHSDPKVTSTVGLSDRGIVALARAACRELLSDEIDHARLGWAHLAAVGPGVRAEVGRWLPRLARANLRMWRASPRPEALTDAVVAHGHPRPEVLDAALVAATRELIVPGCATLGLDTTEVTAWLDAGAPT